MKKYKILTLFVFRIDCKIGRKKQLIYKTNYLITKLNMTKLFFFKFKKTTNK